MNTPQITGDQIRLGTLTADLLHPDTKIDKINLNLTGEITLEDLDLSTPIPESDLDLDYPTHPEDSTLSLENNYQVVYEKTVQEISGFDNNLTSFFLTLGTGSNSTAGVVFEEGLNKVYLSDSNNITPSLGKNPIYGRITNRGASVSNFTDLHISYVSKDLISNTITFDTGSQSLTLGDGSPVPVTLFNTFKLTSSSGYIWVTVNALPEENTVGVMNFVNQTHVSIFCQEVPYFNLSGVFTLVFPISRSLQNKSWSYIPELLDTVYPAKTDYLPLKLSAVLVTGQTQITLDFVPTQLFIFLNGSLYDTYTLNQRVVTLSTPASGGEKITIQYWV